MTQWQHRCLCSLLSCCAALCATESWAQDAASLQARYRVLQTRLSHSQFDLPLLLESDEHADVLQGEVYARIDKSYAAVSTALHGAAHWCELLILHLNVKSCRTHAGAAGDSILLAIGRKFDQSLDDTYVLDFQYSGAESSRNYRQFFLNARKGPLGTSDYRIMLEVTGIDARHSFLHLTYAYQYGLTARLAMQGYLSTTGRNKIGFTRTGTSANGQIQYIGGQRGIIERNTMRYYLAIVAYLDASSLPGAQQSDARLNLWHNSVERYPTQLHELERQQYIEMKHREILRQQDAH